MSSLVDIAVQIVANAGTAKSAFVETIEILLQSEDVEKAKGVYQEGMDMFRQAHDLHLDILSRFAGGEKLEPDILLIHGECQLTSAEDFMVLAQQLMNYVEKKSNECRLVEKGTEE